MATDKDSRKTDGWSRSLLDADDSSDDDASARSPSRSKLHAQRTRTVSSELEGFAWGAGFDHVDIGLVDEPADLKFVETPFTLAKRKGARSKQSTVTSPTARKVQKPTTDEVLCRAANAFSGSEQAGFLCPHFVKCSEGIPG
ncbi:hypothetical protein Rhopal_006141-T1 [Rhodotorula paludigena]|uniref:Uncharacterized protein n=1 Tax=Rhodotorula paludigena TaxID=86838 RepID=A0AAV5GL75_9BASI|nr:hypothetical protein Rhopal_006141-T1 [Rhodotorula paludigena]